MNSVWSREVTAIGPGTSDVEFVSVTGAPNFTLRSAGVLKGLNCTLRAIGQLLASTDCTYVVIEVTV